MRLFQKQGRTNVGYWVPQDPKLAANTLVYLLAYPDRDSATNSWEQFRNDPEWQKARSVARREDRRH